MMKRELSIIGAPSSAGAYAPGQEKAPDALREAGLLTLLREQGINVHDYGNVSGFRWQPDLAAPNAMNAAVVERVAGEVASNVHSFLRKGNIALVLGGDCTVELGTVAGALRVSENVGLIYFDLDADLHTPHSTIDGALDWMGVAHLLDLEGVVDALAGMGPRRPMLPPEAIHLFAYKNIKPWEQQVIDRLGIEGTHADLVSVGAEETAVSLLNTWAAQFDLLLIHFDVDVIDFGQFPIAEHSRRQMGLTLEQAMLALGTLLTADNFAALTISEINPDHGLEDGSTMKAFTHHLVRALLHAPTLTAG